MTQPGVHCAALAHVERALTTPGILRRRRELRGRVRVIVRRAARSYGLTRATSELLERHCVGAALAILAGPALEPPAFGTLYHGFDVLVPLDALGEAMSRPARRSDC